MPAQYTMPAPYTTDACSLAEIPIIGFNPADNVPPEQTECNRRPAREGEGTKSRTLQNRARRGRLDVVNVDRRQIATC